MHSLLLCRSCESLQRQCCHVMGLVVINDAVALRKG